MTIQRDPSGRLQIDSRFTGESMMDKSLLAGTDTGPIYRLMPDLIVVKVGGQSIIDRARAALMPILDELVEARQSHKILITTGGGTRARHAYAIATDLGMPTGVLAELGSSISKQNALMVAILLSSPYTSPLTYKKFCHRKFLSPEALWAHVRNYFMPLCGA